MADLKETFEALFGVAERGVLSSELSYLMQTKAWHGDLFSVGDDRRANGHTACRALVWRVFLRLLPDDKARWDAELCRQATEYIALRERTLPSFDKVSVFDPLLGEDTSSSGGGSGSVNWKEYYKDLEISTFIKGDLDRLYMNGVDEAYFQTAERREILLNILFLWSLLHRDISYRQGMHEIVGPILMVVEEEHAALGSAQDRRIASQFPSAFGAACSIEAHAYYLFERVMSELVVLYDPRQVATSKDARNNHPPIVNFCTKLQEHFLLEIDPDLCAHLESNFVQAQLYGLRWSRLILGREFPFSHSHAFRIWDAVFACCRSGGGGNVTATADEDRVSNYNLMPAYSPLLVAIGNFMLAMLLYIRTDLMESDSTTILNHLLRYPQVESIVQILDYADMIRRGVLSTGAHIYSPPPPSKKQQPLSSGRSTNASSSSTANPSPNPNPNPPSWLTAGSSATAKIGSGLTNLRESVQGGLARATKGRATPLPCDVSTQTDTPPAPHSASCQAPPRALPAAHAVSAAPLSRADPSSDGKLNKQLSERLLDLADMLAKADPLTAPSGRSDINSVLFSLSPGASIPSSTTDAVGRIRLLADVASGLINVADYDRTFSSSAAVSTRRDSGLRQNDYVL